jgi:hypothetical protein
LVIALVLVPFSVGAAGKSSGGKTSTAGKNDPADGAKNTPRKTAKGKAAKKRAETATAAARGKTSGPKVPAGVHPVSDVQVTPFPSHAAAAQKALAQNRRDSLNDAEKAARAEHQDDRWQTVLFNLREFDARTDAEACFWRVVAYYRLGEMARARSIRQLCTLGSKEEALLDTEDGMCGTLQPAAAMPEMLAAGEKAPPPVPNPAPYTGAAPARLDR